MSAAHECPICFSLLPGLGTLNVRRHKQYRLSVVNLTDKLKHIGHLWPTAQADKYSTMAPVDQYMMERNAEILLAQSAAPDSLSSDATILVLGRQGYETAVRGKNGFVCMVEGSWMAAFDSPEFWNPKVRRRRMPESPSCAIDSADR